MSSTPAIAIAALGRPLPFSPKWHTAAAMAGLLHSVARRLRFDSELWRRALYAGVAHGPDALVRYSPPLFGMAFCVALREPRENVRQALLKLRGPRPRLQQLKETAQVFSTFAQCLTEALLLAADRGYSAEIHSDNDGADFKASQGQGQGVILATAHTAGWDVAGPLLTTLQSSEVLVVMEKEEDQRARQLHDEARHNAGVRVVHAGNDPLAALPLLRHLRHNKGIVAMKFDRVVPGMRCREVRFLGESWQVPEGIFTLAALSGAPVMPVFSRRLGFMRYEYVTSPPIRISRKPSDEELDAAAQHLATLLEQFARDNPGQWFRFGEI